MARPLGSAGGHVNVWPVESQLFVEPRSLIVMGDVQELDRLRVKDNPGVTGFYLQELCEGHVNSCHLPVGAFVLPFIANCHWVVI